MLMPSFSSVKATAVSMAVRLVLLQHLGPPIFAFSCTLTSVKATLQGEHISRLRGLEPVGEC